MHKQFVIVMWKMVHEGVFEYLVPSLNHFETLKKFFKEGMAGAINDFWQEM